MVVDLSLITAMITPAVLISACGMLILSTSARLARILERARRLSELTDAQPATGTPDFSEERHIQLERQLSAYARRGRLIQRALTSFYLALGMFVATTITIGLVVFAPVTTWLPTTAGIVGIAVFFYACLTLIGETLLARQSINEELEDIVRPKSRVRAAF
jgi:hypothetical protein